MQEQVHDKGGIGERNRRRLRKQRRRREGGQHCTKVVEAEASTDQVSSKPASLQYDLKFLFDCQ